MRSIRGTGGYWRGSRSARARTASASGRSPAATHSGTPGSCARTSEPRPWPGLAGSRESAQALVVATLVTRMAVLVALLAAFALLGGVLLVLEEADALALVLEGWIAERLPAAVLALALRRRARARGDLAHAVDEDPRHVGGSLDVDDDRRVGDRPRRRQLVVDPEQIRQREVV